MNLHIYRRADGKWAWRLRAANGNIIATDGGQGYENQADCSEMAAKILRPDRHRTTTFGYEPDGS